MLHFSPMDLAIGVLCAIFVMLCMIHHEVSKEK